MKTVEKEVLVVGGNGGEEACRRVWPSSRQAKHNLSRTFLPSGLTFYLSPGGEGGRGFTLLSPDASYQGKKFTRVSSR
jgi:hypothetical protein